MKAILGIGNALVDIMTLLENDTLLDELNLPKGSMQLVDKDLSNNVLKATSRLEKILASGGSAANTIHGLARLGIQTSFIGKVGFDDFGEFFRKNMEDNNIRTYLKAVTTESGRAIALVSLDSERTFATFLGAAVELTAEDLEPEVFRQHHILHIEGYLVQNHDLILTAVKMAKQHGLIVSLDMASYNVVEANIDFLQDILTNYVDIVFANEEEARAFTGKEPAEALEILKKICNIAIVKVGPDGSLIAQGEEKIHVPAITAFVMDTTGAGDLYASGFLYGLVKGYTLEECGQAGSLLAGKVIEVIGAKIDAERWTKIHNTLK